MKGLICIPVKRTASTLSSSQSTTQCHTKLRTSEIFLQPQFFRGCSFASSAAYQPGTRHDLHEAAFDRFQTRLMPQRRFRTLFIDKANTCVRRQTELAQGNHERLLRGSMWYQLVALISSPSFPDRLNLYERLLLILILALDLLLHNLLRLDFILSNLHMLLFLHKPLRKCT